MSTEPRPEEGGPEENAGSQPVADELWKELTERIGPLDGSGPRDYAPAEEDAPELTEHYNPVPEPVLSGTNPATVLSWSALVASIVLALVLVITHRTSALSLVVCVLIFFGSIISLVRLLPSRRDDDDDGIQL